MTEPSCSNRAAAVRFYKQLVAGDLLGDTIELLYSGTATAAVGDGSITGAYSGSIALNEGDDTTVCIATDHRIDFVRR